MNIGLAVALACQLVTRHVALVHAHTVAATREATLRVCRSEKIEARLAAITCASLNISLAGALTTNLSFDMLRRSLESIDFRQMCFLCGD